MFIHRSIKEWHSCWHFKFMQPRNLSGKKIYIVDDDEDILKLYKIVFERVGSIVQTYRNSTQLLKDIKILPHLFILDRQLPGMNGLEICKLLKSQQHISSIPVCIISAAPNTKKLALQAGANHFIAKPFDIIELMQATSNLVGDIKLRKAV